MKVKINNVEIKNIDTGSFSVEQNITTKIDTARLNFLKKEDSDFIPKISDEIEIFNNGEKIYSGIIDKIISRWSGGLEIFEASIRDWTKRLEQKYIANVYEDETVKNIIVDIINNYTDDIIPEFVENIETIVSSISYDYVRPADALRDLAKTTGCEWWVDYDKKLHFVKSGLSEAPFELSDENNSYVFNSLVLEKSDKQLKNTVYIKGGNTVGSELTVKTSDGDNQRKRFDILYKFDKQPKIFLDGIEQKTGLEYLNEFGTVDNYKVLYNYQEKVITFETAPATGAIIEAVGFPLYPILTKLRGTDTEKGVYEYKIVDKSLSSGEMARSRAKAELKAYSKTLYSGSFRTTKNGLRVGQKIKINSIKRNIMGEEYLISQISISMIDGKTPQYRVKLANTSVYEMVEFFRDLLRSGEKEMGIIKGEKQIIDVISSHLDSLKVSESLKINSFLKKNAEIVKVDENLQVKKNFNFDFVWGNYTRQGINDKKRTTFWSKGAVWKNRPIEILTDFEVDFGVWENNGGTGTWTRRAGGTPSSGTGPTGAHAGSYYIYTEVSSGHHSDEFFLHTSSFTNLTGLKFYYHAMGDKVGDLYVDVKIGGVWENVFLTQGEQNTSQSEAWNFADIDLSNKQNIEEVRLVMKDASGWRGDYAIDNLILVEN